MAMDVSRCNHDSDDEEDASTNDEDGDQHFWNEHSEAMQECANALYTCSPTIQTIQTKNRSYEQSLWNSGSVWLDRPSRLQFVSTTNQCQHDCHTYDHICRTQQTMGENSAQDPKRADEDGVRGLRRVVGLLLHNWCHGLSENDSSYLLQQCGLHTTTPSGDTCPIWATLARRL